MVHDIFCRAKIWKDTIDKLHKHLSVHDTNLQEFVKHLLAVLSPITPIELGTHQPEATPFATCVG